MEKFYANSNRSDSILNVSYRSFPLRGSARRADLTDALAHVHPKLVYHPGSFPGSRGRQ